MATDISIDPGEVPVPPVGNEPELVYHYAGVAGLMGIVEGKCLWASDVWYMNDSREARYGRLSIERFLKAMTPPAGLESQVRAAALDRLARMSDQDDPVDSYIACLSKKRDDLSQWRAYGRPRGFLIGFDRQMLQRRFPPTLQWGWAAYRVVTYDETVQDSLLRRGFARMITQVPTALPSADADGIAWLFILESLLLTPSFKDKAFKDEDEIRLQVFHDRKQGASKDLNFRDGVMGLTPYVRIPLGNPESEELTMIREIVVGPQPNQAEAVRAAELLVARNGLNVNVYPSDISLRS